MPHPQPLARRWASALMLTLAALPALAQTRAAATLPELRSTWDLSPLFASAEAWDTERRALLAELPALRGLRSGFGRDAATLRADLDRLSAFSQRLRRVGVYASAELSTDNRNARFQERSALMRALGGQAGAATSWVDGAIQALGADKLAAYLQAEPGLQPHAKRLRDTLRRARHTLHPEAEAALAAMAPVLGTGSQTRTLLATADIEWPLLQVQGQAERVDATGYARLRAHADRAVRKQAFDVYFGVNSRFENSFGSTLAQRVEQGVVNARLRGYASAPAASLAANDIPETVLRTLVAETNQGLPTLHRYLKLRQRLLGLPDLHYYDLYPELVKSRGEVTLQDAAALTLAAVKPLGDEYQALLAQAYAANTMHVYPAQGKSPGAYQSGIYGQTPLIFLNHQNNFSSASTFAHEWGHGMHTVLANRSQPVQTAGYSLFVAEVASFTHELLLQAHVLATAPSREQRLFYLGEALERLRSGYFRQTLFAEFELATHDALQRGEALTGKRMTQMYCGLLRKYYGADQGVMAIDPAYCSEWAVVPHFYNPFYVYQYATSLAGAHHFSQQVLAGVSGAQQNYLNVLRAGGSQDPVPLLQGAGLDLTRPEPYRALIRQMDRLLDEMEKLLAL